MASSSRAPTRVTESPNSPEGGWGIVVVIATFFVNVLLFGLLRCGGILYVSWMNEFDTSARETAAVQSIATSLLCLCGLVGAILCKRFGCRIAGITGGVLSSLGLFCSFWAKSVLHLYVTFFIIGFGVGISYNFGMVAVAMHFDKKYKTANAVAFSGIGTGIMVAPPIFQLLLDRYGWRGTLLIISAIMANSIACAALFRPRRRIESPVVEQPNDDDGQEELEIVEEVPERQASASNADGREVIISETILDGERSSFDSGLHEERDEACYTSTDQTGRTDYMPLKDSRGLKRGARLLHRVASVLGITVLLKSYRLLLLCFLSLEFSLPYISFPLFIIPRAESIGVEPSRAAFLLSFLGIGSLLGQLGNGLLLSCRLPAEFVLAVCLAVGGVSLLLLNLDGYAYLAIASCLQGFTSGAFFPIASVLIRRLVKLEEFALSTGWYHIFLGVGHLLGPVVSGWVFDVTLSYRPVFFVLGAISFACCIQTLLFPVFKRLEGRR